MQWTEGVGRVTEYGAVTVTRHRPAGVLYHKSALARLPTLPVSRLDMHSLCPATISNECKRCRLAFFMKTSC